MNENEIEGLIVIAERLANRTLNCTKCFRCGCASTIHDLSARIHHRWIRLEYRTEASPAQVTVHPINADSDRSHAELVTCIEGRYRGALKPWSSGGRYDPDGRAYPDTLTKGKNARDCSGCEGPSITLKLVEYLNSMKISICYVHSVRHVHARTPTHPTHLASAEGVQQTPARVNTASCCGWAINCTLRRYRNWSQNSKSTWICSSWSKLIKESLLPRVSRRQHYFNIDHLKIFQIRFNDSSGRHPDSWVLPFSIPYGVFDHCRVQTRTDLAAPFRFLVFTAQLCQMSSCSPFHLDTSALTFIIFRGLKL